MQQQEVEKVQNSAGSGMFGLNKSVQNVMKLDVQGKGTKNIKALLSHSPALKPFPISSISDVFEMSNGNDSS